MTTYVYSARGDRGASLRGEIQGDSKAAAAAELRRKGLTVLRLDSKQGQGLKAIDNYLQGLTKIKMRDRVVFSRQFATMISSGLAILRALFILEEQTSNPRFKKIISSVRQDVEAGMPISDAMERHPAAFNRLYVAMVRAGEVGGVLDETLDRLATQIEKQDSLQRTIKSAMAYPVLIGAFSVVVMFGLVIFVIPMFENMYTELGGTLPLLTRIMVIISNFVRGWWFLVIPGLFAFVFALRELKRSKKGTAAWDRMKLKFPMRIGDIIQKTVMARFSRTLATLVSSGVPILQAIDITGQTAGNSLVEDAMEVSKERIKAGDSIARPLEDFSVFPPMVTQMIAIGEETGALDTMLHKIADFYEDEVDSAIKSLTSILEPIMMIVVGGMVGIIVISMYLPIFNMFNLVQ